MRQLSCIFALMAAVLAGCSSQQYDEPDSLVEDSNLNNQQSELRSFQDALSIAIREVGELTPSGNTILSRGNADISLYDGCIETSEPSSRSIYVINFINGGYALVPANAAGDEVIGVSDVGRFNVNRADPNDVGSYILTLASNFTPIAKDSIEGALPLDSTDILEHTVLHNGRMCYKRTNIVRTHGGPLLTTQWHQNEPYSHLCPTYETTDQFGNDTTPHYAVGCVPLAMAQIMTYHRHPASHIDRSGIAYTYDWDLITQKSAYGEYEFTPASLELAKLLWSVAKDIIIPIIQDDKGNGGWGKWHSCAYSTDAPKLFREFQYDVPYVDNSPSRLQLYDFIKIKDQIDKHQPVYVDGRQIPSGGHAWVVDGYLHHRKEIKYIDVETLEVVDVDVLDNVEKVHCNMGSKFVAPGYFTSGIFDTVDGNFSYNLKMIIDIAPNK